MSRLSRVIFLLLCLHAGISDAQTYVRPSDGTVLTLFTATPLDGSPAVTSQIFNMTGFSGAQFYLETNADNCSRVARITVIQASSSAAANIPLGAAAQSINSQYTQRSPFSSVSPEVWTVAPLSAFIKVFLSSVANPEVSPAPGNACTATLRMVPLAFSGTPISRTGFSQQSFASSTAARVGSVGSVWGSIRHIRIQNLSTSVVYCGLDPRLVAPPGVPVVYGVVLKADSGGPVGDGGVADFDNLSTPVYCVKVGAGTAQLSVTEY